MDVKVKLLYLVLLFAPLLTLQAQEKRDDIYAVGFYNLENLFDTIHQQGKNDYEFLPDGVNKWSTKKYSNKIKNIARVLDDMASSVPSPGLAAVGVCEVENAAVLRDLVASEPLVRRGWSFIHFESPDARGVDCALLYNPKLFKPTDAWLVPYTAAKRDTTYITRGFLVVKGEIGGEVLHLIVNHWPSRYAKSPVRERAGVLVRQLKDSIVGADSKAKVVILGDLNDNPDNKSVSESLGAVRNKKDASAAGDLYNPWWDILRKEGRGTQKYRGKWNLFDQIIVNGNLVNGKSSVLGFYKAEIFSRDYMFQSKGKYKGNIKRTHAGGVWLNGYSDHLPVIVYLRKEIK